MALSTHDIRHIAKLARIAVSDDEVSEFSNQLNTIFDLIADMQAVDTTGVAPMAHAQDLSLRLREDIATEDNQRQAFQAVAPAVQNGLYLVPKVIE